MSYNHVIPGKTLLLASAFIALGLGATGIPSPAYAQNGTPSLIVTNGPLPSSLREKLYSAPVKVKEITPAQISGSTYLDGGETLVTRKIQELRGDLRAIQRDVENLSGSINGVQGDAAARSAEYYANVATIQTQLRAGTTPGIPRLVRRINEAQGNLEALSDVVSYLNNEATKVSKLASEAAFLSETAQSTYSVAGAVEEDHVALAELEDQIDATIVLIERLLGNVSEDISRTTAYLASERSNLRTLALAVNEGDVYGRSFANQGFVQASAPAYAPVVQQPVNAMDEVTTIRMNDDASQDMQVASAPSRRALFDRADVDYEQPLYAAVNQALERYPNAMFEVVAVNPTQGNAAEVAIETTKARRNAERVIRTLEQMGLSSNRIELSYDESTAARSNEVHLFLK